MRVAVAMSGGVDSSVAAALLSAAGHDVAGITLQQWPRDGAPGAMEAQGGCCSLSAVEDARRVAAALDIPYYVWNAEAEFGERVIQPFIQGYAAGRTPNPCLLCNQRVRFDLMLERVLELGFDALATGHYARVVPAGVGEAGGGSPAGEPELHAAADPAKDQSYVLYGLTGRQLRHLLFPLGGMAKTEVRSHAREFGLPVAEKRESQDICFVPPGRTREWLAARTGGEAAGELVDAGGRAVGRHRGAALYTVGQRTGFTELSQPGPWYVLRVEAAANRVVVGRREELGVRWVRLSGLTWVNGAPPDPGGEVTLEARLRYRAALVPARLTGDRLELEEPFPGAAPGQAAVFYRGTRVLGGGTVESAG